MPSLKTTGLDIKKGNDITKADTLPHKKFDVVTMTGVHSEFMTIFEWLYNLLRLGTTESTIFVMGYFNTDPVDIVTLWKEPFESQYHRNGFNIPCKATITYQLSLLNRTCKFTDFKMPRPIPRTTDPKRVWTFADEYGNHLQANGLCQLIPFKLLTIYPKPITSERNLTLKRKAGIP